MKVYKLVTSLPFVSLPASDVKGDIEYGVKPMLALSKCSKKNAMQMQEAIFEFWHAYTEN